MSHSLAPQQRKRRSDAGEELRLRPASPCHVDRQRAPSAPLQNAVELRAFGLEDRAEAVISMGTANWSLSHLSQWRHELQLSQPQRPESPLASMAPNIKSQASYIQQRQRLYKQQMLRLRQQPAPTQ